jgi:hypothetical protein
MNEPTQPDEGRLLTAAELAALMRVSLSYVRHEGKKYPFAVRLIGNKRIHGYSYIGFLRWQERHGK